MVISCTASCHLSARPSRPPVPHATGTPVRASNLHLHHGSCTDAWRLPVPLSFRCASGLFAFSCSYISHRPESLITRSVWTCSGSSAVSCASESTSSVKRCSAAAARPASAFPAKARGWFATASADDRAMPDAPRPACGRRCRASAY